MAGKSLSSSFVRGTAKFFKWFFLLILTMIASQYIRSKYYHFPEPAPFSGPSIFNPYADLSGQWLKSNFHAHTKAWGGLTNGHQTTEEIMDHYRAMGYDLPAISNYHKTTRYNPADSLLYFPVYEHGYNIGKVHRLVFGNEKVCFFDIVLWQSAHNKQFMIEHLTKKNPLIALNHPGMRNSYSYPDLSKLTGYQLMEVINTPGNDQGYWDQALSSGKICWIISDDDAHDISKPWESGVSWTMVNTKQRTAASFLESLKNGLSIGVTGRDGANDHYLEEVRVNGNDIFIRVDSIATEIKLVGQNGVIKKTVTGSDTIAYTFTPTDSYIRAVIQFPGMIMHLNPLLRYDGRQIPRNEMKATVNEGKTLLMRVIFFIGWLFIIVLSFSRLRKFVFRRRRDPQ